MASINRLSNDLENQKYMKFILRMKYTLFW